MPDNGATRSQGISNSAQNTKTYLAAAGLCRVGWVWPQFQRAAPKYRSTDYRRALATARKGPNEVNRVLVPNSIKPTAVPGNHRNVKNGRTMGRSERVLAISIENANRLRFGVSSVICQFRLFVAQVVDRRRYAEKMSHLLYTLHVKLTLLPAACRDSG